MKRQCHFSVIIKCGKITVTHWELDIFFILHFTYLGVRMHLTHPPAYGPEQLRECLSQKYFKIGLPPFKGVVSPRPPVFNISHQIHRQSCV